MRWQRTLARECSTRLKKEKTFTDCTGIKSRLKVRSVRTRLTKSKEPRFRETRTRRRGQQFSPPRRTRKCCHGKNGHNWNGAWHPCYKTDIQGVDRTLIDTVSHLSILKPGISIANIKDTTLRPYRVSGEILDVNGRQTISLGLCGRKCDHKFLVFSLHTEAAVLLGTDFLEERSSHNFRRR